MTGSVTNDDWTWADDIQDMQITLAEHEHNIVVYILCKTQLTVCKLLIDLHLYYLQRCLFGQRSQH